MSKIFMRLNNYFQNDCNKSERNNNDCLIHCKKLNCHNNEKSTKTDSGSAFVIGILILFSVLTVTYFSINKASQEYSYYSKQVERYEVS